MVWGWVFIISILFTAPAQAQTAGRIKIGGNVYGGGNQGNVNGNTTVNVYKGDAELVFGGARMANVGGRSFVNVDGEHASGDIMLTAVYGGNDIAGTIGQSGEATTVPIKTYYTAEEAKTHNAGLTGAVTTSDTNPGTSTNYTASEVEAHNAALPGAKKAGDVKDHGLTNVIPEPSAAEIETAGSLEKARKKKKEDNPQLNNVDNTWKTFVATSRSTKTVGEGENAKTVENYPVIIGTLYGGGNGAYYYKKFADDDYRIYLSEADYTANQNSYIAKNTTGFNVPEVPKTYLEIKGGCIAHLYGGGNNATVTENTTIDIDNKSDDLQTIAQQYVEESAGTPYATTFEEVLSYLMNKVKLNTFQANLTNFAFNHARIFGGNNKADMAIRPTWNLQQGIIRDLYSGGNQGRMTSPEGLLLEIDPYVSDDLLSGFTGYDKEAKEKELKSKLTIQNVFGGCRMSDVCPTQNGVYTPCTNLQDQDSKGNQIYKFPPELSARTLVRGGHISNVYGGNDITGTVYGGNAVGIYTTIYGDVYGGGNGAYAYTDNPDFKDSDIYGDYYYDPSEYKGREAGGTFTEAESLEALNDHRPNAEQVSIRLAGKTITVKNEQNQDVEAPGYTIIQGSVYCGGNCATLFSKKNNPLMELKMGSHVIAEKVFLGNNGEKMVDDKILELYAGRVEDGDVMKEGNTLSTSGGDGDYSNLDLTNATTFADYMEGVAMDLQPDVVFDQAGRDPAAYIENSSYVGSFFCGGNVGSMSIPGKNTYDIEHGLNIFDKFVGGCNNANVEAGDYNAAYEGGILGAKDERGATNSTFYTDDGLETGNIKDRLEINFANLTITPLRWNATKTDLEWNTNQWSDESGEHGEYVPVTQDAVNEKIAIKAGTVLEKGEKYYTSTTDTNGFVATGTEVADGTNYYKLNDQVRLLGGNVYGGCYNSGHVNGNITININEDVLNRDKVFGRGDTEFYGYPLSGVELEDQRDDLNSVALIMFGGGYGEDSEVWGSTTVNHNKGYVFQICGGGEMGIVGKPIGATDAEDGTVTRDASGDISSYVLNGKVYKYDPRFSSTVNLNGTVAASSNTDAVTNLAETEYIYGGGKEGLVCGNTMVNLGNGRIYDAFAGACEADILGHSEAYIGRQPDGNGDYVSGFPWIQDIVYGGNDFTGTIFGKKNFKDRVRVETGEGAFDVLGKVHKYNASTNPDPDVLMANAYVEYLQGRVDTIYGGGYGFYDYTDPLLMDGDTPYDLPFVESTFVNIRPNNENRSENAILAVFGGGTGYPGNRDGDLSQNRSYVLVDIPDNLTNFRTTEIFGAGSYNGMGMAAPPPAVEPGEGATDAETQAYQKYQAYLDNEDAYTSIVDLARGKIGAAYGGSFNEGVVRRTMVNVPSGSTINIGSIFGGGYGKDLLKPCDVYEAHVNYSSSDAILIYNTSNELMKGNIYGGNNTCRRTLYGFVDVNSTVWKQHPKYGKTQADVFGAGYGPMTWSEYTQVNLNDHAEVYNVYGGAENGEVLNAESAKAFMNSYLDITSESFPSYLQAIVSAKGYSDTDWRTKVWPDAWTLRDGYYTPYTYDAGLGKWVFTAGNFDSYATNIPTNLQNPMVRTAEMDDRDYSDTRNKETDKFKYNTNVIINEGAWVGGYAYGGGLGDSNPGTGDVYGTTYIALLGGTVNKDLYAAGTSGVVYDNYGSGEFIASSNAYIKGGMARNVYGGGWEGSVGKHSKINDTGAEVPAGITDPYTNDVYGETHVVIGDVGDDKTFTNGKPAITRNVYGGGEGGSVWGTTNLTINNGMIGYRWKDTSTTSTPAYDYVAELDDQGSGDIDGAGNAFGGGYVINSFVDHTNVKMYGGQIRGSIFGGGEVGPVGRGTTKDITSYTTGITNGKARIFKAGSTNVTMFNGHVLRNVFGGGRGQDSWGGEGTAFMSQAAIDASDLDSRGFVFGQTQVNIHGGEVGTDEGMVMGYGNVFGGGDEGSVISAYEKDDGTLCYGKKDGDRYDGLYEGYYFKYEKNASNTWDFPEEGTGTDTHRFYTEDCKVLVEPWLQVKTAPITYGGKTYAVGDYIPTAYLNTLQAKNGSNWPTEWDNVDVGKSVEKEGKTVFQERGIVIHNAVFAGGNIAVGSNSMNANETTVFGNATASIHDVYNRDFITIGTGHTGGLYGDGNLTFVDGYRELNITNYGTDKYHLADELGINAYNELPEREKAYYEVKYKCVNAHGCTDAENTTYKEGALLPRDELLALFTNEKDGTSIQINLATGAVVTDGTGTPVLQQNEAGQLVVPNPAIWQENGVVSTYAGRIMNTIQRADFCGVFGSRMVMKGARDRVPDQADSKLYTINRVREVSLNKMDSPAGDTGEYDQMHGNYFGIYSNVNFFGSLTSDVDFKTAKRTTSNKEEKYKESVTIDGTTYAYGTATFEQWKQAHKNDRLRNNGYCYNQLALASGVYLELTTEKSTGTSIDKKDWGLITGVVELDLINVQTGVGGGYVYAKNEHGKRKSGHSNTTLTALNKDAISKWKWGYETADADKEEWETSGNFIHSSQTIIDDCYNESARYKGATAVPAHYWFISGQVYVYDQYITAHTGSPNAYSETVELPITIYAASNGKMTLMDVQPNLYAYYSSYTNADTNTKLTGDNKVVINNTEYHLNDPISYWDWYKLPLAERKLFVEDTYVVRENCKIGSTNYLSGTVLLKNEYTTLSNGNSSVKKLVKNENGDYVVAKDKDDHDITLLFNDAFRSSNNMSHDTGYLLTYNVTNPEIWQPWYTKITGDSRSTKITTAEYSDRPASTTTVESVTTLGQDEYYDGPTYTPIAKGLYGQHEYEVDDIIPEEMYNTYKAIKDGETTKTYIPNYGLTPNDADYNAAKKQATFDRAYVVTKEYLDNSNSIHYYPGAPVAEEISGYTAPAYICTSTIELSPTEIIYVNDLMTEAEKNAYIARFTKDNPTDEEKQILADLNSLIVPAYICTDDGLYGGDVYESGKNYRALNVWSTMSQVDRDNFTFNYDALDLLIDPTYGKDTNGTREKEGHKYQYDGDKDFDPLTASQAEKDKMIYSLSKPIDYTATYNGGTGDHTYTDAQSVSHTVLDYTDMNNVAHEVEVGAELGRTAYEALPNEQRHYAPITIKPSDFGEGTSITIYVVKEDFVHIETPYAVGSTLSSDEYNKLRSEEKLNVISLTFNKDELDHTTTGETTTYSTTTFYYCRENYKVNEKGMGHNVTSIKGVGSNTTYTSSTEGGVPKGAIIADSDYSQLPNKQKNFTIHGKSPMETSTLYVSRESDINDLSTEKIITVIYKYDYEESDVSGLHVTPVSERHIVNIHIRFESGVPIVDDIKAPSIVLPGTSITMRVPNVTPGAYEVTGGGWEIFEKDSYAENHTNGVPYKPSKDSLYWYQDGYLLAYYAKTYLGKTYSNAVPISVANYHDLKKVMDDKAHHLHVDYDNKHLKRDSKIYINDYSKSDQNGLDLLKDFYDLSLLDETKVSLDADGRINKAKDSQGNETATDSPFKGHALLNTDIRKIDNKDVMVGVKAAENLEFFLRTDLAREDNPAVADEWTPIASGESEPCFNGTLHGDGHTISGLDNSLFGKLCGSVYNLGVMGSFTSAGVVDEGEGYVESCWVKTSGTIPDNTTVKAVFGNPTATTGHEQVVNCYYPESNAYAAGKAKAMSDLAFYNGEVAYDLNNFYLYKRYSDHQSSAGATTYKYWQSGKTEPQTGTYANNAAYCSSGYNGLHYVESRYADDGDFRFAAGEIPETEDERHKEEITEDPQTHVTTKTDHYYPIWPDDYIFFGQKLTYGYSIEPHQDVPSAIAKSNGRLLQTDNANRVYRAPAYYRNSTMGVAHFNPDVYLAQKSSDGTKDAYPGMTAIDFAGHFDTHTPEGPKPYELGLNGDGKFYAPLLDDGGLTSIVNKDETKNLLVYAPAEETEAAVQAVHGYANKATYDVLNTYFTEPVYEDYYDNEGDAEGYRIVRLNTTAVNGHLVQDGKTATNDHYLVDAEEFNAPIAYTFDEDHRMWYQRQPGDLEYVDHTSGWQGISLPFVSELVTTNQKGEITHFYSGSHTSKNSNAKIGHEYWLREFNSINETSEAAKAQFNYPEANGSTKTVTNHFLWNYYYEGSHEQKDKNQDKYLEYTQQYYKRDRDFSRYPLAQNGTPYLLGLPGATYYEFDLSGAFVAQNTASTVAQLGRQVITFASEAGESIGVSDTEIANHSVTKTSNTYKDYTFTFTPNYLKQTLRAADNAYALNAAGSKFDQVTGDGSVTVQPFRPFFTATATAKGGGVKRELPGYILFSGDFSEPGEEEPESALTGGLVIYARGRNIITTSHLKEATVISIISASGIQISSYVLQPEQTVETPIQNAGAYIVNKNKIFIK